MKKTLTVLLVLAVAMSGLFAATGDTLILTTEIEGGSVVGFSSTEVTAYADTPTVIAKNTEKGASGFAGDSPTTSAYVYYQSREQVKPKLTVTCTPFSSITVTTKMGYTLKFGTISVTVLNSANNTATLLDASSNNAESTGKSWKLNNFALTSADEKAALTANDYKATLTVTLTAN